MKTSITFLILIGMPRICFWIEFYLKNGTPFIKVWWTFEKIFHLAVKVWRKKKKIERVQWVQEFLQRVKFGIIYVCTVPEAGFLIIQNESLDWNSDFRFGTKNVKTNWFNLKFVANLIRYINIIVPTYSSSNFKHF